VAGAFVEEEACGLEFGPEEDILVCSLWCVVVKFAVGRRVVGEARLAKRGLK
jgi:hypothetical protein